MKKLLSLAAVLLLSGCYTGTSLFDGPACNSPKPAPAPAPQPCVQPIIQPVPCAQPVIAPKYERLAGVVYFAIGSDYLNDADKAELSRIAQYARANNTPVKVLGHASHKVSQAALSKKDAINRDISIKRTQKVANTLAAMGVNPSLISASAYSDTRPAETEVDARTEALNRRVEIYFGY